MMKIKWQWVMGMAALAGMLSGCSALVGAGMIIVYKQAHLPEAQIHRDISYAGDAAEKHRLDLFLPTGTNWPVIVFVYGGAWTMGDKSLKVGGDDVYGNIGRFYAARGIGVAVINYRLLPKVEWRDQISDVAQATAWVHTHIGEYGGDGGRLFLMGHSAGAQLAARVGLDEAALAAAGTSTKIIKGVISVSGAGLDMKDVETYQLGESPNYFAQFFATGANPGDWQKAASPISYVRPDAPPFLVMCAGGETKALIHQAKHFSEALTANGVKNRLLVVPGQSHARIVLTLSRDDKTAGPAILDFVRENAAAK